jgi:HD-GYP domain-containing protein (c-di-GMP phosphodiesterase class II)
VASAPLRSGGEVVGALTVGATDPERRYGERELRILEVLADVCVIALENATMRRQLERTVRAGVAALALAVDRRDSYTAHHAEQVVSLARTVGRRLGLDTAALVELDYAARLHDVGKIGVPDSILQKPGLLDAEEWLLMREHPVWGHDMLVRIPGLESVAKVVRHEHERWDGDGYPDGLRGDEIPLASRIIFACDAYHAMTSDRPYRAALTHEEALAELRAGAGSQFDPAVIDALLASLSRPPAAAPVRAAGTA